MPTPTPTADPTRPPVPETVPERAWFQVHEVGQVTAVREFLAKVRGLPSCLNGQRVAFANGDLGMVMGFTPEHVLVLTLGDKGRIRAGDEVFSRGEPFTIPVGPGCIGRVISSLGAPMDDGGPVAVETVRPVFAEAPGVLERVPVRKALETGVRTIDASFPIAKGQRQLVIGDQMVGKTTIVTDAILNQRDKHVLCIYCAIGQSQASFLKTLRVLREHGALDYTIVIGGVASAPLGEQYLAPYAACAVGEQFAAQGRDVLIGLDDLGKHAWAYRQLSLLMERPPGREAYPGDIFYLHSQLLERAGAFIPELGGGTITLIPIVPTIQGDITGYIQTNLISITDGQLYLSTALFQRGIRPAIDFGLSVSRIGNRAQCPAMRELSGKLRLDYLRAQDLRRMTAMRADLSADASATLRRGELVTAVFTQPNAAPSSLAEQVVCLYAVRRGLLDQQPALWGRFPREIGGWLSRHAPTVLQRIQDEQALSPELTVALDEALARYLKEVVG